MLDLEAAISERLATELAGQGIHLYTTDTLAGVEERSQQTPAVHIMFEGYSVEDTLRSDARAARVRQEWAIVIATRNAANTDTGQAARQDAGRIALAVAKALMGFKPPQAAGPLTLTGSASTTHNAGFVYLPLRFSIATVWSNL